MNDDLVEQIAELSRKLDALSFIVGSAAGKLDLMDDPIVQMAHLALDGTVETHTALIQAVLVAMENEPD